MTLGVNSNYFYAIAHSFLVQPVEILSKEDYNNPHSK